MIRYNVRRGCATVRVGTVIGLFKPDRLVQVGTGLVSWWTVEHWRSLDCLYIEPLDKLIFCGKKSHCTEPLNLFKTGSWYMLSTILEFST